MIHFLWNWFYLSNLHTNTYVIVWQLQQSALWPLPSQTIRLQASERNFIEF